MLDVRGVEVVGQRDQIVEDDSVPRGQEVEVDKLCWRPQHPLGEVQLASCKARVATILATHPPSIIERW